MRRGRCGYFGKRSWLACLSWKIRQNGLGYVEARLERLQTVNRPRGFPPEQVKSGGARWALMDLRPTMMGWQSWVEGGSGEGFWAERHTLASMMSDFYLLFDVG